ncbi:hypothetical protein J6590_001864 [Homalodisca vitripennis]|nr:hypothetical protein J6590_001864 [Homalodisca vitripennis]
MQTAWVQEEVGLSRAGRERVEWPGKMRGVHPPIHFSQFTPIIPAAPPCTSIPALWHCPHRGVAPLLTPSQVISCPRLPPSVQCARDPSAVIICASALSCCVVPWSCFSDCDYCILRFRKVVVEEIKTTNIHHSVEQQFGINCQFKGSCAMIKRFRCSVGAADINYIYKCSLHFPYGCKAVGEGLLTMSLFKLPKSCYPTRKATPSCESPPPSPSPPVTPGPSSPLQGFVQSNCNNKPQPFDRFTRFQSRLPKVLRGCNRFL